jgi:hypothetical protein
MRHDIHVYSTARCTSPLWPNRFVRWTTNESTPAPNSAEPGVPEAGQREDLLDSHDSYTNLPTALDAAAPAARLGSSHGSRQVVVVLGPFLGRLRSVLDGGVHALPNILVPGDFRLEP